MENSECTTTNKKGVWFPILKIKSMSSEISDQKVFVLKSQDQIKIEFESHEPKSTFYHTFKHDEIGSHT